MSKEESSGGEDAAATVASDAPPTDAPPKDPNADMYENRPKKIIRVVTVMAYLFSVSFAAILLSTYYIFLWEPPNPRLIERERLRADPEMQFLFADAPSSFSEKRSDLERGPLQSRVIDDHDDDPDEKQAKLNTMLMKLRYSLVEIMRAQNGSRSLEPAISDANLFVTVEKVLNSTKRTSRGKGSKYDKNVARGKTRSDDDSSLGFENSTSTRVNKYARNRTSRLFLPANVDNFQQSHSSGMNYPNSNRNNPSSNQTETRGRVSIESSSPRGSKFANDPRLYRYPPDDRPAVVKPWLYTTRNSEGDGRKDKLYEPKHKQKLVRVLTVIAYVIFVSLAAILLSLYYTFVWNPKDQAVRKRIDKQECPKPLLDSLTIPPFPNETQIERMTAKSTTIDNKQPGNVNVVTTTQRQKTFPETEITADVEETSMESVSTVRDYRGNFTSIANDTVGDVT